MQFHSILVGIPIVLVLSVKNSGGGGGGGFAERTKSVKRDESYLSTVPNLLVHELWVMAAVELHVNATFYAQHPALKSVYGKDQ